MACICGHSKEDHDGMCGLIGCDCEVYETRKACPICGKGIYVSGDGTYVTRCPHGIAQNDSETRQNTQEVANMGR